MTLSLVILAGCLTFTGQYAYGLAVKMRGLGHHETAIRLCVISIVIQLASCASMALAVYSASMLP